jgi:hypothetical protein
MADYNAKAASNTFVVMDEDAFHAAMATVELVSARAPSGEPGRVYVYSESDHGTWPAERYDPATDDYVSLDIPALIAPHLADGQVVVLKEAGAEKARYVGGVAVAFNAAGETVTVDLDEIYMRAKHLGMELAQDV